MGIFEERSFLDGTFWLFKGDRSRYLAFFLLQILLHHEHLRTRFAHFLSHGRLLASAQHQRHLEWKLLACGTDSSYQIAQTFIFLSSIEHLFPASNLKFYPRGSKQSDKCTMASIPGAVFKAGKIHDEIARFRKRSASDAVESKSVRDSVNDQDAVFRERSVSFTTPPSVPLQPTPGLTSALSGESIRNLVGGLIGSLNTLKQKTVDSSLESVNEDFPAMRNYPNPGSITDLVHMK